MNMAIGSRILIEIILVVFLRLIKIFEGTNFNGNVSKAHCFDCHHSLYRFEIIRVTKVNTRLILVSYIVPLLTGNGWINNAKKCKEQPVETHQIWIVVDFYRLTKSSFTCTDFFITRSTLKMTVSISRSNIGHSWD